MPRNHLENKKLHIGIGMLLLGVIVALAASTRNLAAAPDHPEVVVGTFDSRAVAMASVRSTAFTEYLRAQKADVGQAIERAKAAGDQSLLADLDALGPAMQKRIHEQGFGTAPVNDILAMIRDKLPRIAKEADVDVIVSKWNLTYRSPAAPVRGRHGPAGGAVRSQRRDAEGHR